MTLPWYHEGLRFACTGCGKCCTGSPGYVWISDEEAEKIAKHLAISLEDFMRLYTRNVGGRLALLERKMPPLNHQPQYDCIFLKGKQCSIYEVRPQQCRTFPFWKDTLHSKEQWQNTAQQCEGIDHADAPLISLEEIERICPNS